MSINLAIGKYYCKMRKNWIMKISQLESGQLVYIIMNKIPCIEKVKKQQPQIFLKDKNKNIIYR